MKEKVGDTKTWVENVKGRDIDTYVGPIKRVKIDGPVIKRGFDTN